MFLRFATIYGRRRYDKRTDIGHSNIELYALPGTYLLPKKVMKSATSASAIFRLDVCIGHYDRKIVRRHNFY